jgi:hypothetical protein
MRPRHSRTEARALTLAAIATIAAIAALVPTRASAQKPATEGALFLLLPIGARAVGEGQAVAGDEPGSEAVWWNPAAIARGDRKEIAIHHSQTIIATGDAVTLVVPSALLGVLAIGANIVYYGREDITDTVGTVGVLIPQNIVYAATYATPIAKRFAAGITYKIVQLRLDCSGGCAGVPTVSASSSALDAGVQGRLTGLIPATVGIAVRNVGPRLQVNDKDQSDPLPTRVQAGLSVDVPNVEGIAPEVKLRMSADLLSDMRFSAPSPRFGASIGYHDHAFFRTGYLFDRGDGEGNGPSFGFGLASGSLVLDIGRIMRGLSADAGKPPTYVSLRYLF